MGKTFFYAIFIIGILVSIFFFFSETRDFDKGYLLYNNGSFYSFFNNTSNKASRIESLGMSNVYKAVNDSKLKRVYMLSDYNAYVFDYSKHVVLTTIHFSSAYDDIDIGVSGSGGLFFVAEDRHENGLIVNIYNSYDFNILKSIKCDSLSRVAFLNEAEIFCVSPGFNGDVSITTHKIADGSIVKFDKLSNIYNIDASKNYAPMMAVNGGIVGVIEQLQRVAVIGNSPNIKSIVFDLTNVKKIFLKEMPYGDWYYLPNKKLIIFEKNVFNYSSELYKTDLNGKVFKFDLESGDSSEFDHNLNRVIGFSCDNESFFSVIDHEIVEYGLNDKKIINRYSMDGVKENDDYQPILWIDYCVD